MSQLAFDIARLQKVYGLPYLLHMHIKDMLGWYPNPRGKGNGFPQGFEDPQLSFFLSLFMILTKILISENYQSN